MTRRRVVAIGLDSADPDLLQPWIDAGELPNFRRLQEAGMTSRFENWDRVPGGRVAPFATEASWVSLLTGVRPSTNGYWDGFAFDPATYRVTCDQQEGGYDFKEFPPFYALEDDRRVAAFDLTSQPLHPGVNGIQVAGWGGHWPFAETGSLPAGLFEEITEKFGKNEILYRDYGVFWNPKYHRWLEKTTIATIEQRTRACLHLLDREPWDLFLASFGETHGPSHDFWFATDATHPVHAAWKGDHDPLLRVFQAVDQTIGLIARRVPEDACFVVFSAHGMQVNSTDTCNYAFLPELVYRFNFPGKIGFAAGKVGAPPSPPIMKGLHWYWFGEIWRRKHASDPVRRWLRSHLPGWLTWPPGRDFLFPYLLDWLGPEVGWHPSVWYRPALPRMRSFVLPSFNDGHVRINVAGREARGIVRPDEYEEECRRVTEMLLAVRDARSGEPIVREVVHCRESVSDDDPRRPNPDLYVVWSDRPVDVVDSPDVGRIGPIPFYRTGGHRNVGFFSARGPGIEAGVTTPVHEVIDFAPTVLEMLGAPRAEHLEGRSMLSSLPDARTAGATSG